MDELLLTVCKYELKLKPKDRKEQKKIPFLKQASTTFSQKPPLVLIITNEYEVFCGTGEQNSLEKRMVGWGGREKSRTAQPEQACDITKPFPTDP